MRLETQIERENGKNYFKIETDNREKIADAVDFDTGTFGYDLNNRHRLKNTLIKFFDTHSEFYDYYGFDAGREHGVTGTSFNTQGWRTFMEDAFGVRYLKYIEDEEHLQLICDTITDKLADIIQEHEQGLDEEQGYIAKSTINLDTTGETSNLTDPELIDESLVLGRNKAYKIGVTEVEDVETLDDIEEKAKQETKDVYEAQVDAQTGALKRRVENLEDQIEEERQEMLIKGLELVDELDDWKVENGNLIYQKTLIPEVATKTRNNNENPKPLTQEAKEKFYIEGVKIPIGKRINRPGFEEAYHPHAFGTVCTGGFGMELSKEGLEKVIEQLKQINLHANDQNDAEQDFRENFDEYTVDDEEEEVEVWEA